MAEGTDGQTITFGPGVRASDAAEFLRNAARDDTFREELTANPIGVFSALGIEISPGLIPEEGIVLPPKEHIEEMLSSLGLEDEFAEAVPGQPHAFWLYVVAFAFRNP